MKASGGCLCGAVRFTAHEVGTDVHACHCSMCRAWHGAPGIVAFVDGITFDGGEIVRYPSSRWAERGFCPRCGSSLFYKLKNAERYYVAMGAFDDQTQFELTDEIYVDEKPPGYDFAGERPRLTRQEFLDSLKGDAT